MTDITLSPDQAFAISAVEKWLDSDEQTLTLGGLAGTGKTTIIRELSNREDRMMGASICAFTGKAASVLRSKGLRATTIHQLIYDVFRNKDGTLSVTLKDPDTIPGDFFVVDESSMVSTDIYRDLLRLDRKILWVGDHGQLEPVGDNPNLMADPNIRLEHIHRQALASPILNFAHFVRAGGAPTFFSTPESAAANADDLHIYPSNKFSMSDTIESALERRYQDNLTPRSIPQIVVAFNQSRTSLNNLIRETLFDFESDEAVMVGEKVICLRNNHDLGIFNGEVGWVTDVRNAPSSNGHRNLRISVDFGDRIVPDIICASTQFGQQKTLQKISNKVNLFDYAYAVTCHKMQGSEAHHVIVFDTPCELWSATRWSYTAATRAVKYLDYHA